MKKRFLLIAAIAAFVFSCAPLSPTNDKAAGSNTRQTWIPLPLKKSRCCANT